MRLAHLYSFFRQSWTSAVFHDRFCDLEQELQLVVSAAGVGGASDDAVPVADAATRAALRSSAAKYLSYNRNLLPMFAVPGQL